MGVGKANQKSKSKNQKAKMQTRAGVRLTHCFA
jgi:hypothetical protein